MEISGNDFHLVEDNVGFQEENDQFSQIEQISTSYENCDTDLNNDSDVGSFEDAVCSQSTTDNDIMNQKRGKGTPKRKSTPKATVRRKRKEQRAQGQKQDNNESETVGEGGVEQMGASHVEEEGNCFLSSTGKNP